MDFYIFFLDLSHNYNENNICSLRSEPNFQIPRIKSTLKGIDSPRYFGPVTLNNIPVEIRSIKNFETFKTEIKKWK